MFIAKFTAPFSDGPSDVRGGVPLTLCGIRFSRETVAAFDPSVVTYGLVDVLGPEDDVRPRVTRTDMLEVLLGFREEEIVQEDL